MTGALVNADSVFDGRLTRLAAPIRSKYFLIADQVEGLRNAARSALDGWEVEQRRLVEARGRHAEATAVEQRDPDVLAARRAGSYRPGQRLEAAAAIVALAEERAAGKFAERDRVAQAAADAGAVLDAITETIRTVDADSLQPVVVKRPDGTNPAADLERVRETLATVAREEVTLRQAPVPLDAAIARQDAWLDAAAKDYTPPVLHFTTPVYVPPGFEAFAPHRTVAMWAAMPEWRDLQRRLLREQYAQLPAALSHADRASLAVTLTERRVNLETAEEALVLLAGERGLELARRPDADARIVLCTILAES